MPYAVWLGDPWHNPSHDTSSMLASLMHQYGLSTRAGSDALPRVLRAAAEVDARAKILSVDAGVAFDHASREAMLGALPARSELRPLPLFCPPILWSSPLLCLR